MNQKYFVTLTEYGEAALANAAALGSQLELKYMAVGDANGIDSQPKRTQTMLINEVYRAQINSLSIDENNSNQVIAELVIPETVGGWFIREAGLYDQAGSLVAVANCPPSYKPQMSEGSGRTQVIRMVIVVSSTDSITLKIDPAIVVATRQYVDSAVNKHSGSADPHPQYLQKTSDIDLNENNLSYRIRILRGSIALELKND